MGKRSVNRAWSDIVAAAGRYSLVGMLGWQDVRQRYRRSALGPFWLTISMGVMIATIGVVFGQIFKSPLQEFLPYLTVGMVLWAFISSVTNEGCTGFIAAEGVIRQLPIPLFVHMLRMIWRNIIIFAHNVVIYPIVLLAVGKPLSMTALVAIPGLVLLIVNLAWVALLLGILCARYRDLPQIVASVLQVVFYITPIMWMPNHLEGRVALYLLDLNPVFHLIEIVRSPLLGNLPTSWNWGVSLGLGIAGWMVALIIYGRYKHRIAFWL